jgi:hypothetical protein
MGTSSTKKSSTAKSASAPNPDAADTPKPRCPKTTDRILEPATHRSLRGVHGSANVVLFTPVVFATAARMRTSDKPHIYACAHLANSASLLLPVSNLTNLLGFHAIKIVVHALRRADGASGDRRGRRRAAGVRALLRGRPRPPLVTQLRGRRARSCAVVAISSSPATCTQAASTPPSVQEHSNADSRGSAWRAIESGTTRTSGMSTSG